MAADRGFREEAITVDEIETRIPEAIRPAGISGLYLVDAVGVGLQTTGRIRPRHLDGGAPQ